jgi:hypothetical protein
MSAVAPPTVRTLAFGEIGEESWGFVWSSTRTIAVIGTVDAGATPTTTTLALTADDATGAWALDGDGIALRVVPEGGPLCRVDGVLPRRGELAVAGLRSDHPLAPAATVDSLRIVLAWFPPDVALAVCSERPPRAAGHDQDEVRAVVFEAGGARSVDDGRLSTTYGPDGMPRRMSLELWLEGGEHSYSRRAAGEVLGPGARAALDEGTLDVMALRCHHGGRDGLGVYALVRAR